MYNRFMLVNLPSSFLVIHSLKNTNEYKSYIHISLAWNLIDHGIECVMLNRPFYNSVIKMLPVTAFMPFRILCNENLLTFIYERNPRTSNILDILRNDRYFCCSHYSFTQLVLQIPNLRCTWIENSPFYLLRPIYNMFVYLMYQSKIKYSEKLWKVP